MEIFYTIPCLLIPLFCFECHAVISFSIGRDSDLLVGGVTRRVLDFIKWTELRITSCWGERNRCNTFDTMPIYVYLCSVSLGA